MSAKTLLTLTKGRLLIVDEGAMTSTLCQSLAAQNYEIVALTSGAAALAALQAEEFDVLIIGLTLPQMNSLTLLHSALKIDPHLSGIIMTSPDATQATTEGLPRGAHECVPNTYPMSQLLPSVARCLKMGRSNSPTKSPESIHVAQNEQPMHTILCIEDNLSNIKLIQMILGNKPNIKLLTSMQGSIGLELARQHIPDLILLDVHLPDILGDVVLRRLQADPKTCEIPVVVVSADAMPSQITRMMEAGAKAYLTKPIDVRAFIRTVEEWLAPQAN